MAITLTRRDIEDAYRYTDRSLSRARDPDSSQLLKGALGRAVSTAEVFAGALGVGFIAGRFGAKRTELKIGDKITLPLDAIAGVAGIGVAISGILGDGVSDHVGNLSMGILAGYGTKLGAGLGDKARVAAGLPSVRDAIAQIQGSPHTGAPTGGMRSLFGGENARAHGGMPTPGAGSEAHVVSPLTEHELASLASKARK